MANVSNIFADYVNTPDNVSVAAGTYRAKIVGASPKVSGGNPANVGLNPQFEITEEGDFKGARVFDGLCFLAYDPTKEAWQRTRAVAKSKVLFTAIAWVPDFTNYAGQTLTPEQTAKLGADYIKPNIMGRECLIVVSNRNGDNMINDYQAAPALQAAPPSVAAPAAEAPAAAAPAVAGPAPTVAT